ncbi:hypothetical protein [Maribacter sp. ACAM166]|uniref:hypothetical protein n=1 Tax=Maribacter sp. ACAM166 TaxID=2508996 RepID=UPI0010FEF522|nr:hypothetical protein [Maribacter sp. ACAM166]TLP75683.1 hypothetical protein ES765_14675 [Maribacter sp. ACAM166]
MAECIDCGKQIKDIYERCYSCNNENQRPPSSSEERNEPSEGELFLQEYFDSEGIAYKTEVPIIGLKNDPKAYRLADFYLPNYGLYVEFLGKWFVSEKEKERYREKKKVYSDNDIPCVFLYPENLGIVDFIIPSRAIKEFKKHGLIKGLWLFRLKFLWAYKNGNIVLLLFLLYVFIFGDFKWEEDTNLILGIVAIICYQIFTIYQFYRKKLD